MVEFRRDFQDIELKPYVLSNELMTMLMEIGVNLKAQDFIPKQLIEYVEADDDDEDNEVQEKMDMIVKDMVEADFIEEMGNEIIFR